MSKQWITLDKLMRPGESKAEAAERMGKEFAGKLARFRKMQGFEQKPAGRVLGSWAGCGLAIETADGMESHQAFHVKNHGRWSWNPLESIEIECVPKTIYEPVPAAPEQVHFKLTAFRGGKPAHQHEGSYSMVEVETKTREDEPGITRLIVTLTK